jgi:hypothetical protein
MTSTTLASVGLLAPVARAATAGCPICGGNLISNPGAEAGPGSQNDRVVKVPGWKLTSGSFTAAAYAWGGGDLTPTTPKLPHRGKNYFYGGPGGAVSTGTQTLSLAGAATAITSGDLVATLSGWLGGYSSQGDNAALSVAFFGPHPPVLKTLSIGPVTEAQRDGKSELLYRTATTTVPVGTATAVVTLRFTRLDGSDNDGMADNLSLVLSKGTAAGSPGAPSQGSGSSSTTTTASGGTTTVPASSSGTQAVGVQFSPQTVVVPSATVTAALRSVSPDGSTYTFSSRTGALARLKVGSVMLLQGITARVVTSATEGPTGFVVVTTPASLTDLITNGTLSWDTPFNLANAYALQGSAVPDENAAAPVRSANDREVASSLGALASLAPKLGMVKLGGSEVTLKGTAGSYSYSVSFKQAGSAVSVTITLSKSSPVDVSASVNGTLQNFFTAGAITVKKSHVSSAKMKMVGLNGQFTLSYELKPLTAFGLGSAGGFKLTLPAEVSVPFVIGGIPFFVGVKTAFYIAVGFSNKNQSIKGSYTINYDGNAGFSTSSSGATSALGAVQGIGKVLLDQANAILSGPITLVLGAQIPQLEVGVGVKGLNVAGFVDVVADTAIKVGGNTPGLGPSTGGCDARDLKVLVTAGAKASFFGFSANVVSPVTLFSKDFLASYPPGCGTVGG